MAAKTWDNGGGDGLWSTANNWSDNAVPAGTDTLTFDGTSVASCTIDNVGTWNNGTMTITGSYTGNITQNVAISVSGNVSIPATMTWTMNANFLAATVGVTGVFTRTAGLGTTLGFSVAAAGTVNLGDDPQIGVISTNAGSVVTATGTLNLKGNGICNIPNGTFWDTSTLDQVNLAGTGSNQVSLNIGLSESAFTGVPLYLTGAGNNNFTGGSADFLISSCVKSGSGGITINSSASLDFGASPTTTSNGITINGTAKVSGTWTFINQGSATPINLVVGSGGTVSGSLTTVNLDYGLTINAAGTWPSGVVLNIDPSKNVTCTITATAHTFGTCTLTGSGGTAFTIAAGTSITLAANQTTGFTGLFTVTGTLNLLGNLVLAGAMTTSAGSTLSGTGEITCTNAAFTMNATGTVASTVGIAMRFTTASGRTFAGAGKTYASLRRTGTGTGTLTITGTNTFVGNIMDTEGTVAHTIIFPNVTTTVGGFRVNGSAGKLVTLARTGAAGVFTMTKSTPGDVVFVNYISVSNSTVDATPDWYAGANSTNGGGNTNWIFSAAPTSTKLRKSVLIVG